MAFNTDFKYAAEDQRTHMQEMFALTQGFDMEPGWKMQVAAASIVFTSPDRMRIVSMHVDRRVVLDVIAANRDVRSTTFSHRDYVAAWSTASTALKAFFKRKL